MTHTVVVGLLNTDNHASVPMCTSGVLDYHARQCTDVYRMRGMLSLIDTKQCIASESIIRDIYNIIVIFGFCFLFTNWRGYTCAMTFGK